MGQFTKQFRLSDDGIEEPEEHESTWDEWGVDVDRTEPDTEYLTAERASTFGVDDREPTSSGRPDEQIELVGGVDRGQLGLDGQAAREYYPWE